MTFEPIGTLQSDFKEKFGVPRQSGMIPEARAVLKLRPDPAFVTALNHLEDFSHVWLIFLFHRSASGRDQAWTPTIRPPRIGAPNRVGVFASRSPHRPNPIGMSAVKLDRIDFQARGGIEIHLSGVDLLDGTPILDLKPYIPYADSIPDANSGWAEGEIPKYSVQFSDEALRTIEAHSPDQRLMQLMIRTLEYDPRPTSQREAMPISSPQSEGRQFRFRLAEFDVHWTIRNAGIYVERVLNQDSSTSKL